MPRFEYPKAPKGETASQAVERYEAFVSLVKKDEPSTFLAEIEFDPFPVESPEIKEVEERLGLKLPPSFTNFISKHNLFGFDTNEIQPLRLDEIKPLDEILVDEGWDLENDVGIDPKDMKYLQSLIPFSYVYDFSEMYCFVIDGEKNGEFPIVHFDSEEISKYAKPFSTFKNLSRNFDEHISSLIDEQIKKCIEGIEE